MKVLKISGHGGWGVGVGRVLVVSRSPSAELTFSVMQAFNFLVFMASLRYRGGFCKAASHCACLPQFLIK